MGRNGAKLPQRRQNTVHRIIQTIALTTSLTMTEVWAQAPVQTDETVTMRSLNIAPGPLGEALNRYASVAGVTLVFDPTLTHGLQSQGVTGTHTVAEGFAQILRGSGLEVRQSGFGRYVLIPAQPQPSQNSVSTLPAIEVVGQSTATSEGTRSWAAQATTIGRREQTLREIPQSVSVLTRQRLDDQNLYTLEQALAHTPGITVNAAAAGMLYDFYARGFPIQNVSFDGVQMLAGWGGFDAQPDTATVDRLEVLRGADGLYSGAGQPGGTVNIVRKRPLDSFQMGANLALGSWDNKRLELDVSSPLNSARTVRGRGVLAWQHKDFFFHAPTAEKHVIYGVLEADIGPHSTIGFGLSYQKADSPMETGHPRASDGSDLGLSRRRSFTANWNFYNFETTQIFADVKHKFNETWSLRANASILKETSVFKDAYIRGSYDPITQTGLSIYGNAGRYESRQYGLDISLEGQFRLFSRAHGVSIGANHIERDSPGFTKEGWNFPEHGTPVSLAFDPDLIPEPAMPHMRKTANTNTQQTGVYGVVRWSLTDALTLVSGARATWYDYENHNLASGVTTNRYKQNGEITPYAGLVWDFHPNYSAYASYTDIFRVQSNLYQASGSPLDPAVGANIEIGIKGSSDDERLNGSIALFRIDETNRSQIDPNYQTACPANPTGGACYINAGKVRSQGIEAELNGEIIPGWHWFAGYTWNTAKYLRDRAADGSASANEGRPFRSIAPKHLLRLHTRYRLPGTGNRWTLDAGLNVQSATYTGSTIIARQPGYAVWNAGVGYTVNPHLALHLAVNNVFDKVYYRRINTREGNMYGEPRSVMLSARAKF